jgi:hypothetical protein
VLRLIAVRPLPLDREPLVTAAPEFVSSGVSAERSIAEGASKQGRFVVCSRLQWVVGTARR